MTPFNKDEVQAELRAVIAEAHGNGTLHTIDWGGMQLRRYVENVHSGILRLYLMEHSFQLNAKAI